MVVNRSYGINHIIIGNLVDNPSCLMENKTIDVIQKVMVVLLILFGLFIAYQLVRKIFGGSWQTEDLVISLLMLNIGITFTIAISHIKTNFRLSFLERQFSCLAKDFKELLINN